MEALFYALEKLWKNSSQACIAPSALKLKHLKLLQVHGSQSVVPQTPAASPGNLPEMQITRSHSMPTESEPLGVDPAVCVLTNLPKPDAHSSQKTTIPKHDDLERYAIPGSHMYSQRDSWEVH